VRRFSNLQVGGFHWKRSYEGGVEVLKNKVFFLKCRAEGGLNFKPFFAGGLKLGGEGKKRKEPMSHHLGLTLKEQLGGSCI